MIDIHNHILPGIDDGAGNLEESLLLAKLAVEEGIYDLIATPHHANGRYMNEAEQVNLVIHQLREAISAADIPLRLHTGQEIRVYNDLIEDFHEGKILTLAKSRYLLLELPTSKVPSDINEVLHELSVIGITAVIAHPERNMVLANHPEKLAELINRGALAQMTTHSINGLFGPKIQEISFAMCKANLIHFLASDAHHPENRPFGMKEAFRRVEEKLGESFTHYYAQNADKLLSDQEISPLSPNVQKKKRFLFW